MPLQSLDRGRSRPHKPAPPRNGRGRGGRAPVRRPERGPRVRIGPEGQQEMSERRIAEGPAEAQLGIGECRQVLPCRSERPDRGSEEGSADSSTGDASKPGRPPDEDWEGRDRFARGGDSRHVVPMAEGVPLFAIAAMVATAAKEEGERPIGWSETDWSR
jgi:hypothetical protein